LKAAAAQKGAANRSRNVVAPHVQVSEQVQASMSTTESVESVQSLEVTVDLETVLSALKQFEAADLFKVIKMATQEAEKRVKGSKVKKEDGPKKPTPSQLQKPTAWVRFTLQHAQQHGWEEFIISNKKSGEEILMPASEEKDGKHVYPNGKEMILTHAMSLSKQRWAPKAAEGTHEELYTEFLAEFEAAAAAAAEEAPVEEAPEWLVPPTIVRKTAEEKAAEMEAKKAEIEAKKAEKKEEREKAKEEAKAAKEAEKAAAKAAKVPKAAVKVVVKPAAKAPAKEAPKATGKEEAKAPIAPIAEKKIPAKKPVPANPTAAVWSCPADGAVHPWNYKGTKYLRNSDNQVWLEEADGSCGDWCGVFLIDENRIDDSVEEPDFE
jgi:hypothetical protein